MTVLNIVLTIVLAPVLVIWIVGRMLDPTVRTPIDALDAIIEHILR